MESTNWSSMRWYGRVRPRFTGGWLNPTFAETAGGVLRKREDAAPRAELLPREPPANPCWPVDPPLLARVPKELKVSPAELHRPRAVEVARMHAHPAPTTIKVHGRCAAEEADCKR